MCRSMVIIFKALIISLIMMFKALAEPDATFSPRVVVIGVVFVFTMLIILRVLIPIASVNETFLSMRCNIFRGYPCLDLTQAFGKNPHLLESYMENLQPVFAFRLMGGPWSNQSVRVLISSVVVGLMFTMVIPLLAL